MLQDPGIESERQSTGRKTGFELGAIQPVHASGSIGQGSPLHRTRAIESPQFLQSRGIDTLFGTRGLSRNGLNRTRFCSEGSLILNR